MNRKFKKIVIGLVVVFFLLIAAAIVVGSVFREQIGRKVLTAVNKRLKSELKVETFDLSLLSGFPSASADLRDVELKDAWGDLLLDAKKVSFRFGLLSLLGSKIKVHSIVVEDGVLNVHLDRQGKANYAIFKKEEDKSADNPDFGISLQQARLKDIELNYQDEKTRQEAKFQVEDAVFSGQFSNKKFALTSTARLKSDFIEFSGARYFVGKDLGYVANLYVNMTTGVHDLEKVELTVDNNVFNVDGFIEKLPDFTDFDLVFTSEEGSLQSILQLLPKEYFGNFGDFKSSGSFHFEASINGKLSPTEHPAIDVSIRLKNGKLASPRLRHSLKEVSFTADFTNGRGRNNQTAGIKISNFKGYLNRELIELSLEIHNMNDPRINFQADGVLPVGSVYGLFKNHAITKGSGEIEFKNLHLQGRYKDMLSIKTASKVDLSGQLEFDDAALTINDEKMLVDRGDLIFKDNFLDMQGVKIEGAGSEIFLDGTFQNLLPVLFADSLNSRSAELQFQAKLTAPKMDLARLVNLTKVKVEKDEVQQVVYDSLKVVQTEKRAFFANFLNGTFDATIDRFSYYKIEGKDFTGKLEFENKEMLIQGQTQAMKGSIELDGTMYFKGKPRLKAKLVCNDIDVREFFRQSENFGQEVLQYQHVSGTMNSKIAIRASWDEAGNFMEDELRVLAGIGIQDGELTNFELLNNFSKYVKIEDLKHVKFANMENWLQVQRRTVFIPAMFVQSNAMNLFLTGKQTFDKEIDYNIKVNAGQVLINKFKKHNARLTPIKAKKKGLFNLYFNIHGTTEDFEYGTAKKRVKANFRFSKSRGKEIKAALLKEFGDVQLLKEPEEWSDSNDEGEPEDDVEYLEGFDNNGGN